jgi:hypothetical protein
MNFEEEDIEMRMSDLKNGVILNYISEARFK